MSDVSIDKKEQYSFCLIIQLIIGRREKKPFSYFPIFFHFILFSPSYGEISYDKESYDRDIVRSIIHVDISILHDISNRLMIYFFKSICKYSIYKLITNQGIKNISSKL